MPSSQNGVDDNDLELEPMLGASNSSSSTSTDRIGYWGGARPQSMRPLPPKTALAAGLLLLGGLAFSITGCVELFLHSKSWDETYGFIILGAIMLIPGSYSSCILFGAYNRWLDFDYSQVPSYDD
jgi:hypothetical protein